MITVLIPDGTRRVLNAGANTAGHRFYAVELTTADDLSDPQTLQWFQESVLTKLPPKENQNA